MNPKSGRSLNAVSPAAPGDPQEADNATAGSQGTGRTGQDESASNPSNAAGGGGRGAEQAPPYRRDPEKTGWIEIELVDEENQPVPGEAVRVTLPDGSEYNGTLDANGFLRIDGIDEGNCKICFVNLDKEAWQPA